MLNTTYSSNSVLSDSLLEVDVVQLDRDRLLELLRDRLLRELRRDRRDDRLRDLLRERLLELLRDVLRDLRRDQLRDLLRAVPRDRLLDMLRDLLLNLLRDLLLDLLRDLLRDLLLDAFLDLLRDESVERLRDRRLDFRRALSRVRPLDLLRERLDRLSDLLRDVLLELGLLELLRALRLDLLLDRLRDTLRESSLSVSDRSRFRFFRFFFFFCFDFLDFFAWSRDFRAIFRRFSEHCASLSATASSFLRRIFWNIFCASRCFCCSFASIESDAGVTSARCLHRARTRVRARNVFRSICLCLL